MDYYGTFSGITRDELAGGGVIPQDIWNINVGASAVIERGMLLGASSATSEFAPVSSAADATKVLVIARDNFVADADHKVTQAYSSGTFHREKIKLGGTSALTLEPFEDQLRKSNIHLRSLQNKFGNEQY